MKYILLVISVIMLNNLQAQEHKIKVYLLGTFHFAQTDTSIYDVLDIKHQKSIASLTEIIYKLHPDKVFIERMPEQEYRNRNDSLYQEYRKGNLAISRNEIWQVAARVANKLGHQQLYQCDQPGMYGFYFNKLRQYATTNNQMHKLQQNAKGMTKPFHSIINMDSLRNSVELLEYLKWLNSPTYHRMSHAAYINVFPQIGNVNAYSRYDSTYYLGANLTIDWYKRNILIYSKIITQLNYDERAIFLIIGNDHIPILKELFNANPYFKVVSTERWLGKSKIKIIKK